MKERTKIIVLIIGGCFFLGLAIWNMNHFSDKNQETVEDVPTNAGVGLQESEEGSANGNLSQEVEEVVYKAPQEKLDEMINVISDAEMPTYFDKSEGNPISVVTASYPKESNYYSIDIAFLDDKTTEKRVSYNITNGSSEYEKAKANGELHKLNDGTELYYYDAKFYWQNGQQYKMMGTLDFMTTNKDDVLTIINSMKQGAKFTPESAVAGYEGKKLLKPTTEVKENEHATVFVQYNLKNDVSGKPSLEVTQIYDKFEVKESTDTDYIKDGFLLNETVKEKIGDKTGHYDEVDGSVYVNAANRSIVFKPTNDTLYEDDKFIKVLAKMIQ